MPERRIAELAKIEFDGARSIAVYSRTGRDVCKDLASEFDWSAEEFQAVMKAQRGNPLLLGLDVYLRARRVAKRLKRARELARGAGVECVKFNAEFRKHFGDVIRPSQKPRQQRKFDWEDE